MRNLILTLIIWTISFTALTIGISLTYTWYRDRGFDVDIHFKAVDGLVPGHSKIMYLGVQIGYITNVVIDQDTKCPRVTAHIYKQMKKMVGEESTFWIVQPELELASIRNLETIASGNYIAINPIPGKFKKEFIGLEDEPVSNRFTSGLHLLLRTESAIGINVGSKVLYNDLPIGTVASLKLSNNRKDILITIYIEKQYASLINDSSSFGNVSGFYANISIFGGSEILMHSFQSLINGAIVVVTPNLHAKQARNNQTFNLLTHAEIRTIAS